MSSSSRQSYRLTARDFTSSSTRHRCKSTSVSSATRQERAYLSFKGRSAFKAYLLSVCGRLWGEPAACEPGPGVKERGT